MKQILILISFLIVFSYGMVQEQAYPKKPIPSTKVIPPYDFAIIQKYAEEFLAKPYHGLMADTVYPDLEDYFIVDIRSPADYCSGHIANAINIPFHTIAANSSLAKLPTDKTILVYCYTGHTASQSTAILNLLGYDAYTLQFSAMAWRNVTQVGIWSDSHLEDVYGANYPFVPC
ncbi:rhodanese-related sulfurtransferases-related [Anaeramoeba ignava]|uniref:Rhodanese-related sulfurtransferases-related n=1 Tax=Anaeramoeba ignava TaxID=1746090 RepID=A0A9Q0LNI8_ANAIG|nr:rhodanese-related sulfurtransferases-related [Anaeramoeba ignava]